MNGFDWYHPNGDHRPGRQVGPIRSAGSALADGAAQIRGLGGQFQGIATGGFPHWQGAAHDAAASTIGSLSGIVNDTAAEWDKAATALSALADALDTAGGKYDAAVGVYAPYAARLGTTETHPIPLIDPASSPDKQWQISYSWSLRDDGAVVRKAALHPGAPGDPNAQADATMAANEQGNAQNYLAANGDQVFPTQMGKQLFIQSQNEALAAQTTAQAAFSGLGSNGAAVNQLLTSQVAGGVQFTPSGNASADYNGPNTPVGVVVEKGDNLWAISALLNHGDGSSWQNIAGANGTQVSDPNLIQVGQMLTIPAGAAASVAAPAPAPTPLPISVTGAGAIGPPGPLTLNEVLGVPAAAPVAGPPSLPPVPSRTPSGAPTLGALTGIGLPAGPPTLHLSAPPSTAQGWSYQNGNGSTETWARTDPVTGQWQTAIYTYPTH